jgi:hypothetical protein
MALLAVGKLGLHVFVRQRILQQGPYAHAPEARARGGRRHHPEFGRRGSCLPDEQHREAVWAISHFIGIGEVVDVALAGVTLVTLGLRGMQGLADLIEFGKDVIFAKTDVELRRAAEKLVRAFVQLGVEAVIALLTRKAQIKQVSDKGGPRSGRPAPRSEAPPRTSAPPEPPKPPAPPKSPPPAPAGKPWSDYKYSDLGKVAPCFPPGTLVRTQEGYRPIEELGVGNEVLAFDEETGMVAPRAVTGVWRNTTQRLVTLHVDGEVVQTTRLHDFWVEGQREWMPAWRLWAGMLLRSPDGRPVSVQAVEVSEARSDSYNLEVEHAHTYFVGRHGVLVHNGSGKPSAFASTDAKPTAIYQIVDLDTGKPIYVGQTTQVDGRGVVSPEERFQQHLRDKPHWKDRNLRPEQLKLDNMTPYEAAVWERHHIEEFKNQGHQLENKMTPIGEKKFEKFQSTHSPCR